jgi:hypothetical protein
MNEPTRDELAESLQEILPMAWSFWSRIREGGDPLDDERELLRRISRAENRCNEYKKADTGNS